MTRDQSVRKEVDRPGMVRISRLRAVSPQLRLDPTLENLVSEL